MAAARVRKALRLLHLRWIKKRGTRSYLLLLVVGLLLLASSNKASAAVKHAVLVRSTPAENSVLTAAPNLLCLQFSEVAQPVGQTLSLLSPTGEPVEQGRLQIRSAQFCIPIRLTAAGTYLVSWQAISLDTDPVSGRFVFSLYRVGGIWASTSSSGTAPLGIFLQVLARWLHLLGYALSFGPVAFSWLVLEPLAGTSGSTKRVPRNVGRLVPLGCLLLVLAELGGLFAQSASLGENSLFDGTILAGVLASSFGRVFAQRLGLALLVWILLGSWQQGSRLASRGLLAAGLVLALIDGQASHELNREPVWLGLLANTIHITAMGLWVGGLVTLLSLWRGEEVRVQREQIMERFGLLALVAVSELVLSGILLAWLRIGQPGNLLNTSYGQILVSKLAVVVLVIALVSLSRRTVDKKRTLVWRVESFGQLVLLILASLLLALPPPA